MDEVCRTHTREPARPGTPDVGTRARTPPLQGDQIDWRMAELRDELERESAMRRACEDLIEDTRAELRAQHAEIAHRQSHEQALNDELQDCRRKNDALKEIVGAREKELKRVVDELESKQSECLELAEEASLSRAVHGKLQREMDMLRREHRDQVEAHERRFRDLERARAAAQAEVAEATSKIHVLNEDLLQTNVEKDEVSDQKDALKRQVHALEEELKRLSEDLDNVTASHRRVERELTERQRQADIDQEKLHAARHDLNRVTCENEDLMATVDRTKETIACLEGDLRAVAEQLCSKVADLERWKEKYYDVEAELRDASAQYSTRMEERNAMIDSVLNEGQSSLITALKAQNADLQTQLRLLLDEKK
mmetsp:Transcript_36635/g.95946  ORF Transcript_36635/g.95946 Transcript_36635/m.95946 type:complete len:368 (-) Transcript_36635:210-1313(-)